MKFKVGDKVKVIAKKHGHGFNIGEIVKIEEISDRDYKCSSLEKNELWWMGEDEFTKVKFIKSDLKDGDIVTYRNGLKKIVSGDKLCGNDLFAPLRYYTEDLKDVDGEEEYDIVKVERSTQYEEVFEREEILDEVEKKYLANVIKPFRHKIKSIMKRSEYGSLCYIKICIKNGDDNLSEIIGGFVFKDLPITKKQIKVIAQPRGKERTEQNVDTYNFKIEEVQVIGNIYDNPELLGGE